MSLVIERLLDEGASAPTTANGVLRASSIGALRKSSRERRDWRGWAAREAAARGWATPKGDPGQWPLLRVPVAVHVVHLRPHRIGWPDVGAAYFLAKAMLDGLVQAGVLADDSPQFVRSLHFSEPELIDRHGVRLTLIELEQHRPSLFDIHHDLEGTR